MTPEVFMGARYSEAWFKASDHGGGMWVRLWQAEFDSEACAVTGATGALCPDDVGAGEVVYLAMYDGPASELCGTFVYEHVVDGRVRRALSYVPIEPFPTLTWTRVEGEPEAWEAPFLASQLEPALAQWRDERSCYELPAPTPDEEAQARTHCARFTRGAQLPRLSEYALCRAVFDGVLQPQGPSA